MGWRSPGLQLYSPALPGGLVLPQSSEQTAWPQRLPRYWPLDGVSLVVTTEGDFVVTDRALQMGRQRTGGPRPANRQALMAELLGSGSLSEE